MTNKDRTIVACEELAKKYRKPQGKQFFLSDDCSLCKINRGAGLMECKGCPLADRGAEVGCTKFTSYRKAIKFLSKGTKFRSIDLTYGGDRKTSVTFTRRAEFFEKIIPILKKIPAKRFTKVGWTYFKELDRAW